MRTFKQMRPLLVVIVVLLLIFQICEPKFLSPANMLNLVDQISVNAIIGFGMTLVILIGGIDLSVGALLALVGTTTVFVFGLNTTGAQSPLWFSAAVLAGLGVAGLFGLFNGLCAATTRMPAFIITLATMLIARGCALSYNEGRPMGIPDQESVFLALGNGRLLWGVVPVPVIVMLALFVLTTVLLHSTRFGQHLYAIGGNREAARFTGIPLVRTEIAVYVICSLLTAVAAMIHTSQLYSAEPASGVMFELNAIAAVVVGGTSFTGGRGKMFGTLIGAIIIGILEKGLNQVGAPYTLQNIVKGAVILAAVYIDVRRQR